MTFGSRLESNSELVEKHLKETNEQIKGWKSELEYANRHNDEKYGDFCKKWIAVWENTLKLINKEFESYIELK